jgi:hypothetical protein
VRTPFPGGHAYVVSGQSPGRSGAADSSIRLLAPDKFQQVLIELIFAGVTLGAARVDAIVIHRRDAEAPRSEPAKAHAQPGHLSRIACKQHSKSMTKIILALSTTLAITFACMASEVVPSPEKTREWTEKDPPKGFTITNRDRYVDYSRDGKVVFRVIQRKIKIGGSEASQHFIEFVANGNVFASVPLSHPNFVITSGDGVYISTSGAPEERSIWVCIPKSEYFEYIEVKGPEVIPNRAGNGYDAMKQAYMKIAQKGFIHPLGEENLLQTETPR